MSVSFISASARRIVEEKKSLPRGRIVPKNTAPKEIIRIERRYTPVPSYGNFIAWAGEKCPDENMYGFHFVDSSSVDVSSLINVKLLTVHDTYFTASVNAVIRFAYEYGIPILWVGSQMPPDEKQWFFKAFSTKLNWELICSIIKL
jgi:hypothetical protein